jgi:hypothetical protein
VIDCGVHCTAQALRQLDGSRFRMWCSQALSMLTPEQQHSARQSALEQALCSNDINTCRQALFAFGSEHKRQFPS